MGTFGSKDPEVAEASCGHKDIDIAILMPLSNSAGPDPLGRPLLGGLENLASSSHALSIYKRLGGLYT